MTINERRFFVSRFLREACQIVLEKEREIMRLKRRLAETEAERDYYRNQLRQR